MALNFRWTAETDTTITVYWSGLERPAYTYPYFYVEIYLSSGQYYGTFGGITSNSTVGSFSEKLGGFTPNTYYRLEGYAKWDYNQPAVHCGTATGYTDPPATPAPSALTGLKSEDVTTSGLKLSWNASTNATYYEVRWGSFTKTVSNGATSTTISNLTSNTTYKFTVTPYNGLVSGTSSSINVTTNPSPSTPAINNITVTGKKVKFTVSTGRDTNGLTIDYSWLSGINNWEPAQGSYTNKVYEIELPNYNTSYWIDIRARWNHSYYSSWTGLKHFTTGAPPKPSVPVGLPPTRVDGGIKLNWNATDHAEEYDVRIKKGTQIINRTTTSTSYTERGLEYGSTYYVSVRSSNITGKSNYSTEEPVTTTPKLPDIVGLAKANSIDVYASVSSGNFSYINVAIYRKSTKKFIETKTVNANGTVTFSNLEKGAEYEILARSYYTVNNVDLGSVDYNGQDSQASVTIITNNVPDGWTWFTDKVSGNPISVTADEWNAFQDKINEFHYYKHGYLVSYYSYYNGNNSFTRASKDANFMAYQFNQAVILINGMTPSVSAPGLAKSRDNTTDSDITADKLNGLKNSLNSIT